MLFLFFIYANLDILQTNNSFKLVYRDCFPTTYLPTPTMQKMPCYWFCFCFYLLFIVLHIYKYNIKIYLQIICGSCTNGSPFSLPLGFLFFLFSFLIASLQPYSLGNMQGWPSLFPIRFKISKRLMLIIDFLPFVPSQTFHTQKINK